jgi:hypothetical protein
VCHQKHKDKYGIYGGVRKQDDEDNILTYEEVSKKRMKKTAY